ncbi:LacI family DNA-binding transcriptional regulator [Lysinibacter cavernae]|uniref:DNA-binding LacI/PurR family transcriptional regulator n=1 Tax=Lysinibacter cavernae TaxID=1640652 RepID=A0A7X5R3I6_9MICO|nr:substrate-binding domain-containing protein [Lysinibacter cavernae]NIH54722.1 DNA-binding LacI/PurR family transcriptional regulator [Lysinibacter cavernae]
MSATSQDRKRVTLADVAALAGVSTSTVSIAFSDGGPVSDAMRERVRQAAAQLGYTGPDPRAASLRRGRSGLIGVVLDERLGEAFRDPIRIALLDGIADEIGAAGSGLALLGNVVSGPLSVSTAPVDAIILFGCSTTASESLSQARQRGIPAIELEGPSSLDIVSIDSDNRGASAAAARHLAALGHQRVAMVTLPLTPERVPATYGSDEVVPTHNYVASERALGIRDVFPDAVGRSVTASLVEEGRAAGFALLADAAGVLLTASVRPTAIAAQSDLLALGVIRAATDLGLDVPGQLSVIGFDGIRLDGLSDRDLSTLVQPAREKGRAAGRAAIQLVEGEDVGDLAFYSELRVGDTTGPAPSA